MNPFVPIKTLENLKIHKNNLFVCLFVFSFSPRLLVWSAHSEIKTASTDGTNVQTLVNSTTKPRYSMTFDYSQERLYWVDMYSV